MSNNQEQPKEHELPDVEPPIPEGLTAPEIPARYNPDEGITSNKDKVLDDSEITNNDGSVIETFDTAFHGEPGMIKEHSIAGSNRADYYEARSDGQSDSEEELEVLRKQQSPQKADD